MISANAKYWIWLTKAIGYCTPKAKALLERYPDISSFFENVKKEARLCGIFTPKEADALCNEELARDAEKVLQRCRYLGDSVLTIDDEAYPERLYHIYNPPAVLYIRGTLPNFDNHLSIGIVGTRKATRYGVENSYKIGYSLAKYNVVVVSGGALGVDCASHRGVLAAGGVTVCVRGCGIHNDYLRDNADMRRSITGKGAVISEYLPDESARNYYFPQRNRIIAALSDGVLLIEAGERSGSLITANLALEMGKDVFALVGNNSPQNKGSNQRIKENSAAAVTDFMDILAYYNNDTPENLFDTDEISFADVDFIPVKRSGQQQKKQRAPEKRPSAPKPVVKETQKPEQHKNENLEGDAKAVYESLSAEPIHIDTIAGNLKLPVFRALSALTLLEMEGLVQAHQGRKFSLK